MTEIGYAVMLSHSEHNLQPCDVKESSQTRCRHARNVKDWDLVDMGGYRISPEPVASWLVFCSGLKRQRQGCVVSMQKC